MIIFARKHFSKSNASLFHLLYSCHNLPGAVQLCSSDSSKEFFFPLFDMSALFRHVFLKEYWGKYIIYLPHAAGARVYISFDHSVFSAADTIHLFDYPKLFGDLHRNLVHTCHLRFVTRSVPLFKSPNFTWLSMGQYCNDTGSITFKCSFFQKRRDGQWSKKTITHCWSRRRRVRVLSFTQIIFHLTTLLASKPAEIVNQGIKHHAEYEKYFLGNVNKLWWDHWSLRYWRSYILWQRHFFKPNHQLYVNRSGSKDVEYKIAPPESMFIIGSSSVDNPKLYVIDINSISKSVNKRNKRVMDIALSLFFFHSITITDHFTT